MVFNALYLTGAFVVTRLLFRLIPRRRVAFLACVGLAALAGLLVEWFAIGNSPWGNPDASQIGMAAYWACLVVVPQIAIEPEPRLRPVRRSIFAYGVGYIVLVLMGQVLLEGVWRDAYHLWTVIAGYVGLIVLCVVRYLPRSQSDCQTDFTRSQFL